MLARKIVLPDSACHKLAVASLLEWYTPAKICIPTYACRSIQSIFLHLMPYTCRPSLFVMFSTTSSINLGKSGIYVINTRPALMQLDHGGFCLSLLSTCIICRWEELKTRSIFHPLTGYLYIWLDIFFCLSWVLFHIFFLFIRSVAQMVPWYNITWFVP